MACISRFAVVTNLPRWFSWKFYTFYSYGSLADNSHYLLDITWSYSLRLAWFVCLDLYVTAVSLHCQLAFLPSRFIVVRMLHRYVHEAHVILIKRVLIHVHLDSRFVIIISHASGNQRKRARHCYKACHERSKIHDSSWNGNKRSLSKFEKRVL